MTVICCASLATMEAAQTQVKQIQIELYGDWTFEQAEKWLKLGISNNRPFIIKAEIHCLQVNHGAKKT